MAYSLHGKVVMSGKNKSLFALPGEVQDRDVHKKSWMSVTLSATMFLGAKNEAVVNRGSLVFYLTDI